jgi:hypothetical protein
MNNFLNLSNAYYAACEGGVEIKKCNLRKLFREYRQAKAAGTRIQHHIPHMDNLL